MKRRCMAVILIFSMLLGSGISDADSRATESRSPETKETAEYISGRMSSGRIGTEEKELPEQAVEQAKADRNSSKGKNGSSGFFSERSDKASAVYKSEWDKYKNHYFYNQLSESEKALYDLLDECCLKYLTTSSNAEMTDNGCYLAVIDVEADAGIRKDTSNPSQWWERIKGVMEIFRSSNPQYYFLDSSFWGSLDEGVVSLGVYRVFASGRDRKAATASVKEQLDTWEAQVAQETSDMGKVTLIHDLIVNKVTYNFDIEDDEFFDDEEALTQTAYSVLCMDSTVCTGYSRAFELLCNGADVDAVAVTSESHVWNKVRINDSWYNVDCTWDDTDDEGRYDCFLRNDACMDMMDKGAKFHRAESFWGDMLPVCSLDSKSPDEYTPRTVPVITRQVGTPEVSASGNTTVISSPIENAKIYYSLDETVPSPSSVKCRLYRGAFTAPAGTTVKAVAVCNEYLDSETAVYEVPKTTLTPTENPSASEDPSTEQPVSPTQEDVENGSYRITYKLNGGKNSSGNPAIYSHSAFDIILENPTRKGYTFKGWYEDSGYKKKVTRIAAGSTGDKTLYAKWQANKYKVVFKGNGKVKGKMSAMKNRKYGKSFRLKANKFKRKGYRFVGWSTKKNGKGKRFANRKKVKNLTSKANGKVTLYARWKKK